MARARAAALVLSVAVAATIVLGRSAARAQDVDILVYSSADGAGQLVASDDFAPRSQVFPAFCVGGACLFSTTDPGFRTATTDVAGGPFALDAGTQVALEIVSIASGAAVKVGAALLDAPGESAALGSAPGMHVHPEWQVTLPQGQTGDFAVSFRLRRTSGGPAYAVSPTYVLTLTNVPPPTPSPPPSPSPSPSASPSPSPSPSPAAPSLAGYVAYKAHATRRADLADKNTLPRDWVVTLDDVLLDDAFPADPENHLVVKAQALAQPASLGASPAGTGASYLRYALAKAKEGIGDPLPDGRLPKAESAPERRWSVTNDLGSLVLDSGQAAALWLPSGIALDGGPAADPGDATHFLCYQAKAAPVPSDQAPAGGSGKGRFRRDLQAFFWDAFADCLLAGGTSASSFAGTPVEGRCLVDLKQPKQICAPAAKSAVLPPRTTSAVIAGSTPAIGDRALVCYAAKLARTVANPAAAALSGLPVGSPVEQRAHVKRRARDGTQVATQPGNLFPRPVAVDTDALELLCLPSTVASVEAR